MNKKLFLSVLLAFCFSSFGVQAQLKIDGVSGVERVLTTVTTKVEEVMKKVNAAAKSVQESQIGQSLKTAYETAMAMKQKVEDVVKAGKEAYAEVEGLYEEGKSLYEEGKGFVEETKEIAESTYEKTMEGLKQSQALSTVTLKNEMDDLQKKMDDRKALVATELESRSKMADENIDALQELYNSATDDETKEILQVLIAEAGMLKQEYADGLENMDGDNATFLQQDEEYQNLQQQYAEKQELLKQAEEALKEKGMGLASSFIKGMLVKSPEQKTAEYEELIGANFIGPNEKETGATVARVDAERQKNVKEDVINGLVMVINSRKKESEQEEKLDMIADNMSGVDYAITAQRLANEQNIQEFEVLNEDLGLEVAGLKLKTSKNMLIQPRRVQNPAKNPGEINLDNYVLTEDILKEKGLGK